MADTKSPSAEHAARTYFKVEPAGEASNYAQFESVFRRLHNLGPDFRLECLLVAGGDANRDGVDYYLGTDADDERAVEHALHSLVPDDTAITAPDRSPQEFLRSLVDDPDETDETDETDPASDDDRGGAKTDPTTADTEMEMEVETDAPTNAEVDATEPSPERPTAASTPSTAAVEYIGWGERRGDWQMQLRRLTDANNDPVVELPLAGVVDTLANTPEGTVAVYQAILEPFRNWSVTRTRRQQALEWNRDTIGQRLGNFILGNYEKPDPEDLGRAHRNRLDELEDADTKNTWAVNARAYVQTADADADTETDAEAVCDELASAFGALEGEFYAVVPVVRTDDAADVLETIRNREHRTEHGRLRRLGKRTPIVPNTKPAVITDPEVAPAFCVVDGESLTQTGQQALDTTPGERAGITPPTDEQLETYDCEGLTLGCLLDENGERTDTTVSLPPSLQPLHVLWGGKTGSGKSVGIGIGGLDNIEATDGPDIIFDSKGDGMAEDLLKAYYKRYGNLDNVYYFECDSFVPAISFFDISEQLDAGIPRASAVEDTIDHYIEILEGIMGDEQFDSKRAPDVIRYLLKAMYDPVHGSDAFTQSDLDAAAKRMKQRQSPPAVSDPHLERMLAGVAEDRSDVFDAVMQAVNGRIEKVTRDRRIARLFEHVHESAARSTTDTESDGSTASVDSETGSESRHPSFDLSEYLDEDCVIIFDTGGLRKEAQRALVLVVLSNLWTALRQRERRRENASERAGDAIEQDPPLVNLYIEEAADVANTSLMSDLLAKSRSFGLSITLAMQFPGQLRQSSPRTYDEVLNNVSTIVTGNVGRDAPLAERLATDDMPPSDVANRLRGLRRGQWLAKLPAEFDEPEPRPFLLASADPPAGHPASDDPLSPARQTAFEAALHVCKERTREEAGLTVAQPSVTARASGAAAATASPPAVGDDRTRAGAGGATDRDPDTDTDIPADAADGLRPRVDTTLPYTKRLPEHVTYDAERHVLRCTGCDAMYDPDRIGRERILDCCPEGEIDTGDVPICEVNLKLTREERRECDYTDAQLMFLQVIYNAGQLRYEPPGYDILWDSMLRLHEYVGIDDEAVEELLDDGLLRHDTDHPHRLYTVSPEGRTLLGEKHRRGVDHGHGKGDLGESTQHGMAVEGARQWAVQEFEEDSESEVAEVIPYYELDGGVGTNDDDDDAGAADDDQSGNASRLDVAGLDADGNVVVCIEVERINNDVAEAVPSDYDKMAACNPEEAIWVVMTQSAGHDVLKALNDSGRVEKTYADTTPPQQFRIDEPGLTAMYPVEWIRDRLA